MASRTDKFKVVVNHKNQYSIIPITQHLPRRMREVGRSGTTTDCMKYIEEVWTDMSPIDKKNILKGINR